MSDREPDSRDRRGDRHRRTGRPATSPGTTGTPRARPGAWPRSSSPCCAMASGGGPTNTSDASRHAGGERGVLGEKAIAWVDGLGARAAGRVDDGARRQVALLAAGGPMRSARSADADVQGAPIGVRVHRDRLDTQLAARADDADGNLAAIGDQDAAEHEAGKHRDPATGFRVLEECSHALPGPRRARALVGDAPRARAGRSCVAPVVRSRRDTSAMSAFAAAIAPGAAVRSSSTYWFDRLVERGCGSDGVHQADRSPRAPPRTGRPSGTARAQRTVRSSRGRTARSPPG